MEYFDAVWQVMADEGKCDALFSKEYTRVRALYLAGGALDLIRLFIEQRANDPEAAKPRKPSRKGGAK